MSEPSASGANPAATAAAEPPLDPPGTRLGSRGLRVGPNAEFSVDEPIANSSRFVLPIGIATGVEHPLARRSRCTAAPSLRGSATSRSSATPRVQRLSFSAIGTPGERARVLAVGDRGVDRVGRGERGVAHHEVERVDLGLTRRRSRRGTPRPPTAPNARRARTAAAISRAVTVPRPGCAGPGSGRPPLPAPAPSTSSRSRDGPHLVRAQHVDERERVRGRLAPRRGRARRRRRRARGSPPSCSVNCSISLGGEREPGQVRDVFDVGAGEPVRHQASVCGAGSKCGGGSDPASQRRGRADRRGTATSRRAAASSPGRDRCSRPGTPAGRHFPQPLHSSGTMITSIPWLKIAPNCGGQ